MSDWTRTTRECPFTGLPAEMQEAIIGHIQKHNLGDAMSDRLMCIDTVSSRSRRSLLGGDETVEVSAVITPRWLFWAIKADRPDVTVMSARLADVVVEDYAESPFSKLIADNGIEVNGSFTAASDRGQTFIGLGEGPEADKFKKTVLDAVLAARK